MPGNYVWADSPVWQRELSEQEQITQIQDYLFIWAEQMRYVLRNLDDENFNDAGLRKITAPVYLELEKESEELTNRIAITAEGLTAQISSVSSQLSAKVDSSTFTLAIEGVEGQITTVSSSVSGLTTRVSNAEGSISTIDQNIKGITFSVSNGQSSSTLSMTYNGTTITAPAIQILGMVTFTDLSTSGGSTVIDGRNISTGYIEGIDYYSLGNRAYDGNGFKFVNTGPHEEIGGINYKYFSDDGVFRDKIYIYTEEYEGASGSGTETYYPSIKMTSAGRISMEATGGLVYIEGSGLAADDGGVTIRTPYQEDAWGDEDSGWIRLQSGNGVVFSVRPDGIYRSNTKVL